MDQLLDPEISRDSSAAAPFTSLSLEAPSRAPLPRDIESRRDSTMQNSRRGCFDRSLDSIAIPWMADEGGSSFLREGGRKFDARIRRMAQGRRKKSFVS